MKKDCICAVYLLVAMAYTTNRAVSYREELYVYMEYNYSQLFLNP